MFFASQGWRIFCVLHPFRDRCPRTSSSSFAVVKSSQTTERTLHAFSCISIQLIVLISFLSGVTYGVLQNCRHHWCPPCAHRDRPSLCAVGLVLVARACEVLLCIRFPDLHGSLLAQVLSQHRRVPSHGAVSERTLLATCLWACLFVCLKIKKKKNYCGKIYMTFAILTAFKCTTLWH